MGTPRGIWYWRQTPLSRTFWLCGFLFTGPLAAVWYWKLYLLPAPYKPWTEPNESEAPELSTKELRHN